MICSRPLVWHHISSDDDAGHPASTITCTPTVLPIIKETTPTVRTCSRLLRRHQRRQFALQRTTRGIETGAYPQDLYVGSPQYEDSGSRYSRLV